MEIARDGDAVHTVGLRNLADDFTRRDVEHGDVIAARDEKSMRRAVDRKVIPAAIAADREMLHDVIVRCGGGEEEGEEECVHRFTLSLIVGAAAPSDTAAAEVGGATLGTPFA